MKKILLLLLTIFMISGCGGGDVDKKTSEPEKSSTEQKASVDKPASDKKILVVYFSRTGEEYNVGRITTGNTAIVADFIAQKVDADKFEIKPATPYPDEYEPCTEVAKTELESNARPALANDVDISQYDTIFLGNPIWWGDLPMIMYTFLEGHDFSGKTIIPFCTSAGNYMTGKEAQIPTHAKGSTVRDGLGIVGKRCQDNPESVRKDVEAWLQTLGY